MNHNDIKPLEAGGVTSAAGFMAGSARGGIKTQGPDVAIIAANEQTTAAGVFTRNQVKAAPVWISAQHLQTPITRGIVFNAGNANCCTGELGSQNAHQMCELAAAKIGCAPEEVLVCSTGIIGHQLPME